MHRILSASKDAYITNKVINNQFRATDANVGQAGTLDLFKLFEESTFMSGSNKITGSVIELSRLLLQFDLSPIKRMQSDGKIDINSNSFSCHLKLHDIYGGQTTPDKFNVIVFPLSRSFDEGSGYDVKLFQDLDTANFLTASFRNGVLSKWRTAGAMASGTLNDRNIDVIVSGTLKGPAGSQVMSLSPTQYFKEGTEDLEINITKIISGTISGQIPDRGLLVAFSGSHEIDNKTYFVKRFASRDASNTAIRPKIIVRYDDSIHDNHEDFIFDTTGSLYLNNFAFDSAANIVSGNGGSSLTGANVMILKIASGSFKKTFNVSQVERGENRLTGLYSASFAISSFETLLRSHIVASGSVTFDEIWSNSAETITYLSSSLTIKANQRTSFNNFHQNLLVTVTNLRDSYKVGDVVKLRVFSEDRDRDIRFKKLPFEKKSQMYHQMYYRVRDFKTGDIIVDFDTKYKSTRLSTDSGGMYFEFYVDSLPKGRTYVFDFLIRKNGFDTVVTDTASKFRVE
tara:strand:+ start:181 stop:1719 length:1539 start_codon:yes stop_codon:yes gene_type:complete